MSNKEEIKDDLVAWLDGEVDDEASQQIETQVNVDPRVRAEADTLRQVWEMLDYLPKAEAPPNFTQRTMDRLAPQPKTTQLTPVRKTFTRRAASWILALLIPGLISFAAVTWYLSRPDEQDLVRELSVVEHLRYYQDVQELAFLQKLDQSDLFHEAQFRQREVPLPARKVPDADAPPETIFKHNKRQLEDWREDPNHSALLDHNLKTFWDLPRKKQEQIRRLDREIRRLPLTERKRLWRVMERYHRWLHRLGEEKRQQVNQIQDPNQRFVFVSQLRQDQWITTLPRNVQDQLNGLAKEDRSKAVNRLRQEQQDRFQRWLWGRPTKLAELPFEAQQFVRNSLIPLLSGEELNQLNAAEGDPYPAYLRVLNQMSKKHPIRLPGPVGPVRITDLPDRVQNLLTLPRGRAFREKLEAAEGRWPEFGIVLHRRAFPGRSLLPEKHRPDNLNAFSKSVRQFVQRKLIPLLTQEEQEDLKKAEGQWPEYPKELHRLARKHQLKIPGTYLLLPRGWDARRP